MINKIREFSIPLIGGVILALIWANLNYSSYENFIHFEIIPGFNIHWLINDVFMYFFFATAGIEIVHSVSPGGVLHPVKKAATPLIATLGGVLGPIFIFITLNHFFGDPSYFSGWGIGTATDIALAWLLARIVFGAHHPAVNFLLLLAVADDAIGLIIIAVFYPDPNQPPQYLWLLLAAAGMLIAFIMRKMGVKHWWAYMFIAGVITWFGMYKCGMHPSLASVLVVIFMPNDLEEDDKIETKFGSMAGEDPARFPPTCLENCEHKISGFVDFGLIFFGLTNAGVQFSQVSTLTFLILTGLIVGKTLGITLFTQIATRVFKLELPEGMNQKEIVVAGFVAGMGLTVALYIAGSAFVDFDLQAAAKMGALFSAVVFLLAPILGKIMKVEKIKTSNRECSINSLE